VSERLLRVVMTLAFYPRGGSAQVARYLTRALEARGVGVTLCCGSLGCPGASSHAGTFFAGLDVRPLDFTDAVARFEQGEDPMTAPVPVHPSFEDRPGVPDRVFTSLDDTAYRRQVAVWRGLLDTVDRPHVYHVHHLTHVNDAVAALGDTPVVAHLHGTELKMLDTIRSTGSRCGPHALAWQQRLRAAAQRASRLVVVSAADQALARELLGVDPDSIDVIHNGVDLARFTVDRPPVEQRLAWWRRWLVQDPQGWDTTGVPGSVSYSDGDLQRHFIDPATGEARPVLLYVGRFLAFKRVPLLIRAYARARTVLGSSAPPLVIWGGYPGEWEGDHPHSTAQALGVDGVFFAGWRGHNDLPVALNCADAFVAPSVDEPFGQVYLEAMACRLPVIATRSGGPLSFINTNPTRPNGWLVTPDAEHELADAIIAAVTDPIERDRRGSEGRTIAEQDYDWLQIAKKFKDIYRGLAT